jgi:hypothetical protein
MARSISVVPWAVAPVVPGFPPEARASPAVAVGHIFALTARLVIAVLGPPGIRSLAAAAASGDRFESRAAGVGHSVPPGEDEQAPAEMTGTH